MHTAKPFASRFPLLMSLTALILVLQWSTGRPETPAGEAFPAGGTPSDHEVASLDDLPFPITPPDADKISVGPADGEGYATVSGAARAVAANASVIVVNLNARTVMTATAGVSGDFDATLYAPAGSSLLVKYELDGPRIAAFWQEAQSGVAGPTVENLNPLPGTILRVGEPLPAGGNVQPFQTVSAFFSEDPKGWAGWQLSGEVQVPPNRPDFIVQQGDTITLTANLRVTAPAINCTGTPLYSIDAHGLGLRYLFDADGRTKPWGNWFNAHLFTPTGLPIEHEAGGEVKVVSGPVAVTALTCLDQHVFEGQLATAITIPNDLPDGIYRPEALLLGDVPLSADVPLAVVWYHNPEQILALPSLVVGSADPTRLPVTLLGDSLLNGHRGLQAHQDEGVYELTTRVLYPPHRIAVPRLDARSGEPLVYRLEPGIHWLSATERRLPNPPHLPLHLPSGELYVEVVKPDGTMDQLGPAPIMQSSVRAPSLPDGSEIDEGTGHIGDLYHLTTMDDAFAYQFEQYGPHVIHLAGAVEDVYGHVYHLDSSFDLTVARVLDLDPAQLPTTPYMQGDAFAPGLHIFPPVPAEVEIRLLQMPFSDPDQAEEVVIGGQANRFGYFQPPAGTEIRLEQPGEFRVDVSAEYVAPDGTLWAGYVTWGNVVEGANPLIEAHGRRGMDYKSDTIDDMPPWFLNQNLPPDKIGIENYYPYFSGDVHWGDETPDPVFKGDSIHSVITLRDLTGANETIYNLMRAHYPRATNIFRWPPLDTSASGLEKRLDIGEAPLFMTTASGVDPAVAPEEIDMWGYWYASSERPDVHVRELLSEDGMGTAYWRFNDTYGYQIGEPADGDQPGDMKWEFGGGVFRVPAAGIAEYAAYSSLWVLLPHGCDAYGCARVTPPFQDATGAGINGGPILTLLGQEIDMLFLPKGVRPGDVLEVGDTVAFSGHVGPPLDSRVEVAITSPSGVVRSDVWHANKIGWLYDPTFDFIAEETGRWTVDVFVEHDRPYVGNGVVPQSHNTGTVLGTAGQYEFYVVEPGSPRLFLLEPPSHVITWPGGEIEPILIRGVAPAGTTAVHYTIHDKGIVMAQGSVTPDAAGAFTLVYDAEALHADFPMLSLTAHEGRREGLADEVAINMLAVGGPPAANTLTLIGEEMFSGNALHHLFLPVISKP